ALRSSVGQKTLQQEATEFHQIIDALGHAPSYANDAANHTAPARTANRPASRRSCEPSSRGDADISGHDPWKVRMANASGAKQPEDDRTDALSQPPLFQVA